MGNIIDGKKISAEIRQEIAAELSEKPGLAVILVGDDPASQVYVRNKEKACHEVGFNSFFYKMESSVTEKSLIDLIKMLNNNHNVHGILVQLPLPDHINEDNIINAICPEKDVDCFHPYNLGRLVTGNSTFLPCTPAGVIEMLKRSNIEISGKECVIIGRSNIVGKPLAMLMLQENATVTVCHSKTKNLKDVCKRADILISAIGNTKFVDSSYVKKGAVVIDVGINRDENGKLCGDVNFDDVIDKASFITPVPGGVGPMTITMLLKNTLKAVNNKSIG